MIPHIDARTLKAWLADGCEVALIDVREHGQYGAGHPFFAVSLPYSRFELRLADLVPNPRVRLVLMDADDGVAARAALRADALGYSGVHVLSGGAPAWSEAGYRLFAGVNVPSKTFGELVEHVRQTPRVSAEALQKMRAAGEDVVIVDGRPFAEYRKMNIPGGICCPNGELALRIGELVPDARTKIVVNCAGRTRSIIGAQTLIDFGVPNPVYALENGTQGWSLAGFALERSATRRYADSSTFGDLAPLRARAADLAARYGAAWVSGDTARSWLADAARTTYLFDVRTPEECEAAPVPGFRPAPGGQLIQATDQWVGVKGARLVLLDAEGVRAPVVASWLRQLGHEAFVLTGGTAAAALLAGCAPMRAAEMPALPVTSVDDLKAAQARGRVAIIDLRSSSAYREGHIPGAVWSIRPRVAVAAHATKSPVLVADEPEIAALAALDLAATGATGVRMLAGGHAAWCAAGLPQVATATEPPDDERIDFLFFVHARHEGDAEAARRYLAWEIALPDQLDEAERAVFRLPGL